VKGEFTSVSVVIPVLNGSPWINEALDSIARQTLVPFEVIVVDGGSGDDSESLVRQFSMKHGTPRTSFLWHEETGAASKRNIGACKASGEFIAFLDADDVWPEERTERLLSPLIVDQTLDCVTGNIQEFRRDSKISDSVITLGRPVATRLPSAALLRRSSFERVGYFSTQLRIGETIEWWSRAEDAGFHTLSIDFTVLLRRIHESNLGRTQADPGREYLAMLRQVLQRRRKM
jgi:glycosyltransferase involved in cell wall biosynthesis